MRAESTTMHLLRTAVLAGPARSVPPATRGLFVGAPTWRVRALRAGHAEDRARLERFFRSLSPTVRRWRFHGAVGELPAAWIDHLARPDPHTEAALLAEVCVGGPPVPVGEARFVAEGAPPGARELAIAVADGWQGHGIGLALMHALERAARRLHIQELFGDVQRDNLAMLGLAERAGFHARRHPTDPTLVRIGKALEASVPATTFQL